MDRIGRFEIQAEIGHGGFGYVYRAFDPKVGRVVAVKVLTASNDASTLTRFRNEAIAAGGLRHKNIVTVYEFGDHEKAPYLVMEYLDGEDLQKVSRRNPPLSLYQKVDTMSQVGLGLFYAHNNGVLHRDVKPANIILLKDGSVKLLDFGIAKLMHDDSTRLTQNGLLIGTVLYMSPEMLLGGEPGILSDIWAYGVIFYELLAGQNPFAAGNARAEMLKITTEEPPDIACEMCPESLQPIVRRLLSKERELRYQSMDDVLFELEPILVDLKRGEAEKLVSQAEELYQKRKLDDAQQVIRGILELDPDNQAGRMLRERVQRELKRPRIQAITDRAEEEARQRHFPEAIQLFDAALKLDSQDSLILRRLEELRDARERCQAAVSLLASARQELRSKSLTGAFHYASEALAVDPGNPDAAKLMEELQREIQARDIAREHQECVHKARGLIAMEDLEGAIGVLTEAEKRHRDSREIKELLARALALRSERNRRRDFSKGLDSAKELLRTNQLRASIAALERLNQDFPGEVEGTDLLSYARQELQTTDRAEAVEQINRDISSLTAAHRYSDALSVLNTALRNYPGEVVLTRLLRSVLAGRRLYEQEHALKSGIERCGAMRAAGRYAEALTLAAALLKDFPNNVELLEQCEQLRLEQQRAERAAALTYIAGGVKTLLHQERAEEAIQALRGGLKAYPNEAELEALLSQAVALQERRKREYIASQLEAVANLNRRNQWHESRKTIQEALAKFPDSVELLKAKEQVEAQVEGWEKDRAKSADGAAIEAALGLKDWIVASRLIDAAQRRYGDEPRFSGFRETLDRNREAELASGVQKARHALDEGRLDDATALLQSNLGAFAGHPAVLAIADEVKDENRRRAELARQEEDRAKAILQCLRSAGKFEAARNWAGAMEELRRGLGAFPGAQELLEAEARIEQSRLNYERGVQIAEEMTAIQAYIAAGNWQPALDRSREALKRFPGVEGINRLEAEAREQRNKYIARRVAAGRAALGNGDLDRAEGVLGGELAAYAEEAGVRQLAADVAKERTRRLETMQAEESKRDFIAAQLLQANDCAQREEYANALALLKAAQKKHPSETVFAQAIQRIQSEQDEAERKLRLAAALTAIKRAMELRKWDDAVSLAQNARVEFPEEPSAVKCLDQARRAREEAIDELVARGKELVAAQQVAAAELILRNELKPYGKEAAVIALAASIECEHFVSERAAEARRTIAARRFKDAGRAIQEVAARAPTSQVAGELQSALRAEQERERKEQLYTGGRGEADKSLRRKQYQEAIDRYEYLLTQFPKDAQLEQDLGAAIAARDRQERLQQIEVEVKRLAQCRRNGDAVAVREGALILLRSQEDARARELLEWAEAKLATPEPVPLRDPENVATVLYQRPGVSVPTNRPSSGASRRRNAFAAAGLLVMAAGIGSWAYFRPRDRTPLPGPSVASAATPSAATLSATVPSASSGSHDREKPVYTGDRPAEIKVPAGTAIRPPEVKNGAKPDVRVPPEVKNPPKEKPVETAVLTPPPVTKPVVVPPPSVTLDPPAAKAKEPAPIPAPPEKEQEPQTFDLPYGTIVWTGSLNPNESVRIRGGSASIGRMKGALPGGRVNLTTISPSTITAEALSDGQIVVHNGSSQTVPTVRIGWAK